MDELDNISYNPDTDVNTFLTKASPLVDQKTPDGLITLNTVQSLVSGNSYTGPNPGNKGAADPYAYNKALADAFESKLINQSDPLRKSRTVSFDASRFGHNFDRYYNHPKFKTLGFGIYRDNESLYNAKSTWLDDFNRMRTQWLGLAGQALVGTYKGWGRWGDGTDTRDAAIMENALSIAQSSKEGLGAWFTNFAANGAYTFGIAGSILLEELALGALTAGSGGVATPLAATRTAMNATRFGAALSRLAKSLNNVSDAKSFWQTTKGFASGAADFINPLRQTTEVVGDLIKGEKTINRLSEMAKTKKTFGAFYRDMREINLVLSESRLEGGFAKNKVVSDATAAFIKEKGRMPNENETKEIYENAQLAGVKTSLLNMPAIYLSNRIVFDTMFKGFKPIGRLINPGTGKNPFFKVVRNYDWKKGMAGGPFSVASAGFKFSDLSLKSLKGTFSRLSKEGLPTLAGKAYRYTSANLAEGLQESFQEVAQMGYTDYYLNNYYAKLYNDPFLAANNSMAAAFDEAFEAQFSKQGLDVFLSGFLMGGGMQVVQNLVMNKGQLVAMRLGKKEKYEQYRKDQEDWAKKQVDALNSVAQDPIKYAKWIDQNLMLQRDLSKEYEQAVEEGDEKTANDVQRDSLFHHVHTLIQSGRYDTFIDSLKDLRQLDSKDLADAFENVEIGKDKNKSLHERLEKVIAKAENIKDRVDLINEEYPNPFNYNLIDPKKSPEAYMDELRAYTAFEEAKKHAMFSEYTFGEALKRMDSIVNKAAANNPIGAAAAPDVSLIYSPTQSAAAIETLKTEISALSQGTPEQKKQAKSKERTLEHLKNLNNLRTKYGMILYLIDKAGKNSADALAKLEEELEALDTKSLKLYDENGKKINFKSASVPVDVKLKAFYTESLKDTYMAYMKNIAKTKNVYPVLEAINQSFVDYLDFLALNADARSRSEDIDALANPNLLLEYSQRIAAARKIADEQRQVLEAEALEKYRQYATNNKLMQDLLAIGVYFDPESFDEFKDNDVIPDRFIDVRTGQEVTAEDPRYAEIIDLINNYEQATGKTFSGKPVAPKPEAPPTPPSSTQAPPPDDKEKGKNQPPPATTAGKVDVTTLPKDTQDQLRAAFEEAKKAGATDFDLWIEESVIAQSIIQGKKPKAPTPTRRRPVKNEITVNNPKSTSGPDSVTAPIYANPAVLSADETGYIFNDPETGKTVNSKRVTSLKRKKVPEEVTNSAKGIRSTERGNVLDDITRYFGKPVEKPFETNPDFKTLSLKDDILNAIYRGVGGLERQALRDSIDAIASQLGNKTHKNKKGPDGKPLKYSITMTDSFKDSLVEVLRTMAIELEDYTWNTNLPSLHGVLLDERYAGSVDLLLEKNGEYFIVDLKSSETSRRAQPDIYDEDTIQLNAYADLFEQMTGKPIKGLYIINMIVTSSNDGKVLDDVILDTFVDPNTGEDSILIPFERKPISELLGGAKSDLDKLKEQEQEALDAGDMALGQILRNQIDEIEKKGTTPAAPKPPSAPPPTPPAPAAPAAPVSDTEAKKADVILPIGTSGSGKSTFIKSLPQENLVVISPDDMRIEFTGDINDKSKDKEIYIEAAKRAVEAVKNGKQVVFDTTNLTKEKRRPFIEAVKKAIPGANIQYKLMPLNAELAKQRIKADIAAGVNRANVSDETIDRHAASYPQMLEDIKAEGITEYKPTSVSTDAKADIERRKRLGQDIISHIWTRLAKQGITNTDSLIGTRETIDNVDFDKFWSNVTKEDLLNLKSSYEANKKEQLYIFKKYGSEENKFIPELGIFLSSDTSFLDNKIKDVDAELAALGQSSAPEVKPTGKRSAPEQYTGQIIYAVPGSVNPAVFDTYDIVNGDEVLKEILVAKGLMSSNVSSDKAGVTLYKLLVDDKKISAEEHTAITNEASSKMRDLANSGKTVVTSNDFMADPSKVDVISLPAANEVFYLERDPAKSVDRFKNKIATKDYIKALYDNPDIADKVTRANLQDMLMGEIKDNPIIQSIMKASDPQLVMTKIQAFFAMDEEARASLFYHVNSDGEQVPYSEKEMVELGKKVITKIEKNKEEREVFLSELDELLPAMTPETPITPEEKESVTTAVESGKDLDESQGTLRNLFDEAKNKTPEQLREELLKKAGCKPDSNEAPF